MEPIQDDITVALDELDACRKAYRGLVAERDRLIQRAEQAERVAGETAMKAIALHQGIGALVEKLSDGRYYGSMWQEIRLELEALTKTTEEDA